MGDNIVDNTTPSVDGADSQSASTTETTSVQVTAEPAKATDSGTVNNSNNTASDTTSDTKGDLKQTEISDSEPIESPAEKRIKQLVAKQRDAEREAAYWRGVAEGGSKTTSTEVSSVESQLPTSPVVPNLEDFETFSDYEEAKDAYLIQRAKFELEQEFHRELEKTQKKQREQEINKKFQERLEKAVKTDPEILDILQDRTLPISKNMAQLIKESDVSPDVIRYLNNNRQEASRIAQLDTYAAAREIGRIEAIITTAQTKAEPPKKITQAPEPIQTVTTSGGTPDVDEDKLPMEEWAKRRNMAQYGRK